MSVIGATPDRLESQRSPKTDTTGPAMSAEAAILVPGMATEAPTLAWEKRKGESNPAWQGFVLYRDLGPERTLAKVAKTLGKSKALVEV